MVFNTTFNNNSVTSWRSALLVEDTGVPGENHRPATSHWQTLSHNVVSSTPRMSSEEDNINEDLMADITHVKTIYMYIDCNTVIALFW